MKTDIALFICVSVFFAVNGCGHLEPATRDDCEAVLDHMTSVMVSGLPEADASWKWLLIKKGTDYGMDLLGEKDNFVKKCMALNTRGDVRCALRADTGSEIDRCLR